MPINWAAVASGAGAVKDIGSTFGSLGSLFGKSNTAKGLRDQFAYNMALQKQAQSWNEKVMKNRYQWQSDDLDAAGINKLYGLGSAPSPVSGTTGVGLPDYTTGKNGRLQKAAQLLDMAQNWSAKKAEIENIKQQTKTEWYNTQLKAYESINKEYETLLNKKELDNWDKKRKLELQEMKSRIEANIAKAGEARSAEALNTENVKSAKQTRDIYKKIKEPEIEEANNKLEWRKKHPKLRNMETGAIELKNTLGAIMTGVGIAGGGAALARKGAAAAVGGATSQKTAKQKLVEASIKRSTKRR